MSGDKKEVVDGDKIKSDKKGLMPCCSSGLDMTVIRVNVGGRIFHTCRATLLQMEYFQCMFHLGGNPDKTDYTDTLIDRDENVFSYLLNCMRDSQYIKLAKLIEYKPDIDYFQIPSLLTVITNANANANANSTGLDPLLTKHYKTANSVYNEKEQCVDLYPPVTTRNNPGPSPSWIHVEGLRLIELGIGITVPKGYVAKVYLVEWYLSNGFYLQSTTFGPGVYKHLTLQVGYKGTERYKYVKTEHLFAKLYLTQLYSSTISEKGSKSVLCRWIRYKYVKPEHLFAKLYLTQL
jgi:hypothetical protein